MYIPCVCIVALSWVSFWIDPDAIPARVGLSITTVLTICYMLGSVNSKLPRVSYLKAIDYFLLMSFGFIFFTLVEYVFVLRYSRKMKYVGSFTPGQRAHLDLAERGEWVRKITPSLPLDIPKNGILLTSDLISNGRQQVNEKKLRALLFLVLCEQHPHMGGWIET